MNNYAKCRLNAYMYFENALAYTKEDYRRWASSECLDDMRKEMDKLRIEQADIEARLPPIEV